MNYIERMKNRSRLAIINETLWSSGKGLEFLYLRTGLDITRLHFMLMGKIEMSGSDFLAICDALGLDFDDFQN